MLFIHVLYLHIIGGNNFFSEELSLLWMKIYEKASIGWYGHRSRKGKQPLTTLYFTVSLLPSPRKSFAHSAPRAGAASRVITGPVDELPASAACVAPPSAIRHVWPRLWKPHHLLKPFALQIWAHTDGAGRRFFINLCYKYCTYIVFFKATSLQHSDPDGEIFIDFLFFTPFPLFVSCSNQRMKILHKIPIQFFR